MAAARRNTLKFLRATKTLKAERRPARVARVNAEPSTAQIVRAFMKAPGHEKILERIPKAANVAGWDRGTQVAYFSVASKSGSALWLDMFDADHFDGVTNMQRCVTDNRAWFSDQGYTYWNSAQTRTGRINCYFNATAADHSCVVQLQSDGPSAVVECLIDNQTFGNLTVNGTLLWPHFATLSAGGHSFRIRQVSGAFFFLSLTVYRF